MGEADHKYKTLVGPALGKWPFGVQKSRWVNNTKIYMINSDNERWLEFANDCVQ
jgi:hypothetical protein